MVSISFIQGLLACLGLLLCLNVQSEQGVVRVQDTFTKAMIGGAVLFVLVCWLESPVRVVVFYQLLTCAFISLAMMQRRAKDQVPTPGKEQNYSRFSGHITKPPIHLNRYTHFTLFAFQLALGLSLGLVIPYATPMLASIAGICTIVVCAIYHRAAMRFSLTLGELGKVVLPAIVVLLFCVAAGGMAVTSVVFLTSIAFIMVLEMMNINWLVRTASVFNLDAIRHIASGRLPLVIGITAGFALGVTVNVIEQQIAAILADGMFRLAVAGAVAALVVFAYAFLPFNQGTPVKEGIIYSDLQNIRAFNPEGQDRQGRPFKELCAEFGSRYGLTPREQEVLFLLACGYNAESIAQILIVSASTVRTHVYRIYTKTDLHSQQELIVKLDNEFERKK